MFHLLVLNLPIKLTLGPHYLIGAVGSPVFDLHNRNAKLDWRSRQTAKFIAKIHRTKSVFLAKLNSDSVIIGQNLTARHIIVTRA